MSARPPSPVAVAPERLAHAVPPIARDAHKGSRGRVLIIGGSEGMAGAVHYAACGALRSGAGLVRAVVAPASVPPLQGNTPAMVTHAWGEWGAIDARVVQEFAPHALVIGPGLGRDPQSVHAMESVLQTVHAALSVHDVPWRPHALVLDADALHLLERDAIRARLREIAARCAVVLTPHLGEFRSLLRSAGLAAELTTVGQGAAEHAALLHAARILADDMRCTVVLKGTPTWCVAPEGPAWVSSRWAPTLATGGTGDVLSGMIGALLAAHGAASGAASPVDAADVAAAAVWVHARAGEMLMEGPQGATVRGVTVDDVVQALPQAWRDWTMSSVP